MHLKKAIIPKLNDGLYNGKIRHQLKQTKVLFTPVFQLRRLQRKDKTGGYWCLVQLKLEGGTALVQGPKLAIRSVSSVCWLKQRSYAHWYCTLLHSHSYFFDVRKNHSLSINSKIFKHAYYNILHHWYDMTCASKMVPSNISTSIGRGRSPMAVLAVPVSSSPTPDKVCFFLAYETLREDLWDPHFRGKTTRKPGFLFCNHIVHAEYLIISLTFSRYHWSISFFCGVFDKATITWKNKVADRLAILQPNLKAPEDNVVKITVIFAEDIKKLHKYIYKL